MIKIYLSDGAPDKYGKEITGCTGRGYVRSDKIGDRYQRGPLSTCPLRARFGTCPQSTAEVGGFDPGVLREAVGSVAERDPAGFKDIAAGGDPEDIIGLKVQAIANNPLRRAQDTADIQALANRFGATLNWPRILEYYALFDLSGEGQRLQKEFGHAQ